MSSHPGSLSASSAFLAILMVVLVGIGTQWIVGLLGQPIEPELSEPISVWIHGARSAHTISLLLNLLLMGGMLFLADRIAVHLLLIAPHQRPTLYLIGSILLLPSLPLFHWSMSLMGIPSFLIGLYLLMQCYDSSTEQQRLTVAGVFCGGGALLIPPMILILPVGLLFLPLLRITTGRSYVAFFLGMIAPLWLLIPSGYFLLDDTLQLSYIQAVLPSIETIERYSDYKSWWIAWGGALLLWSLVRIGSVLWSRDGRVNTRYRQHMLLFAAGLMLLYAPCCGSLMSTLLLLSLSLMIIPLTPIMSQLSLLAWKVIVPVALIASMVWSLYTGGVLDYLAEALL